jgi:hypothetical protein
MFWQFVGFNADLALVTNPETVEFNSMYFCVSSANRDITILAFDHVPGTVERVYPVIGHRNVLFAVTRK